MNILVILNNSGEKPNVHNNVEVTELNYLAFAIVMLTLLTTN